MIKIPYEKIIEKIKEDSDVSDDELEERINNKLKQLSGLISKEGAAHIVANELGVKLFEPISGKLQIKNILSGIRDVETVGKVLQIYDVREFETQGRSGKVGSILIGDETDTIRVVFWGSQTDNMSNIKKDDVIKILGGYVKDNQGRLEIHINDRSQLIINPKDEVVENVVVKTQRKNIKDLAENDSDVELLGTVVQVFEPRFFEVCKQCGKRARIVDGNFACDNHSPTEISDAYVLNAILDDSTDTIRAVFFRAHAEKLLNLGQEEFLKFKGAPEEFVKVKESLPGSIIKIVGRVNKNQMFDRLEFIANHVDINPNPEEELQRLEKGG